MATKSGTFILTVELSARQQQQLVAASDELGVPMHQVGEAAIVAFLEQSGHKRRGKVKASKKGR